MRECRDDEIDWAYIISGDGRTKNRKMLSADVQHMLGARSPAKLKLNLLGGGVGATMALAKLPREIRLKSASEEESFFLLEY